MNSNSRRRHSWTAGLVVLLATSQAAAQPSATPAAPESATEARAHFDRGVTFYDEADYSAALVEFSRAYAIAPTWQVLFNIGQSYFQIHDYARALVTLKRFVDEGQDRIPTERRALVDAERADLGNRVGHASIACNVEGATLRVDDVVVGVAPLSEPVLVSVGVRKISATVAGREPVEREASVPVGETVDVRLDFSEPPAAQAAPVAAPAVAPMRVERSPTPRNHTAAIAALSVAAAGATAGVVFGALALHDKSRLEGECAGRACAFGSQSDIDAVSRDGTVSTIAFGVAAVGAVAGVVLWLAAGPGRPVQDGTVPAGRTPAVSFKLAPGFVAGRF